jgi:phenylacetate-CoA ligase
MIKHLWLLMIASIQVHVNQFIPTPIQKKLAERRVLRTIRNAYETVPYYREKYEKAGVDINAIRTIGDLKKIPFITKDEIRDNFPEKIVASGTDIKACHYSATTGSTGRSLPFVFSPKTFAFYMMTSLRVYTMIGYRPWHKLVYVKYTKIDTPNFGPFFRTAHIPSTITIAEQITMLLKENPDLLVGYASIIHEIAQRITDDQLKTLAIRFVSVNSEMSTQDQREFIARRFGCPVYDEYSTEETWMITSQCKKHRYHLFIDNVWVEFLDKEGNDAAPGEIGEMVLTTTRSDVMPFIRYRIGDLGRCTDETCTCRLGFPLIQSFDGRADDSFILPSGKFVSSLKILNTFTKFIKAHLHLMEEFKVVQQEKGLVTIYLVRGKEYDDAVFKELIDKLQEIFGEPVTIALEFVNAIDKAGSIKRKAIESRIGK